MSLPPTENAAWYRAAPLTERLTAGIAPAASGPIAEDELAQYRWRSWLAQPPFDRESYFAQRLALDGLTAQQLQQLLLEPPDALRARFPQPPDWLADLQAALTQPCCGELLSGVLKKEPAAAFLTAAAPFIAQACARFDEGLAALSANHPAPPFEPSTIRQLFSANLAAHLFALLNRTLVLELHVARLSGDLQGATPEARFHNFSEHLRQPARLRALLEEYPVLARLLLEGAQHWVTVSLEFLARLCQDWAELKQTFAPDRDPELLTAVRGGLSDAHHGGRSVFIAQFRSGLRLVYKPKSLAVDAHFQQLLHWLNARGAKPSFPTLMVLERAGYGWVEHVQARACRTVAEVQRFYHRQGGYLALLYLLEATDFHAGNVIACGESPYLIDLEALFHPHRNPTEPRADDTADTRASRARAHSLLRIGLLPERVWGNSENEGVDRSGLGTLDDQLTPHALPHWEAAGTDAMHLVRKRKHIRPDQNRPRLGDAWVNVVDYRQEILDGFTTTYELLLAHRAALLAADGPVARFAQDEVCVFLRSMRTYRRLLRESYHPDVLRDALDRDRHFDLLWVEVPDNQDLARVIQIERAELLRGDIPAFSTRPASRDLWLDDGARLPDFFAETSLSIVQRRLQRLSHEDCARQAWFIQASLATLPVSETPAPPSPAPARAVTRAQLHAAAQAIGDRLEQLSFRGPDDAAWLGLLPEREQRWMIDSLSLDLDAGLPGVTLFLAYLGARTAQTRYTALAQATLTTMQRQLQERGDDIGMIGAFDGWGGLIYTLTQLGALWRRNDLLAEAETMVQRLPALIAEDDVFDVYGGSAGCIGALRCLARVAPSDGVTAAAIQCGDHLLAHASSIPAAGFLRGTAGIAWALGALHEWTGLKRFRTAAPALPAEAEVDGAFLLASIEQHGWRCGTPLAVETPGLLSGLAGIGMQLLRAAEPECVPSVLLLDAPLRHGERQRDGIKLVS